MTDEELQNGINRLEQLNGQDQVCRRELDQIAVDIQQHHTEIQRLGLRRSEVSTERAKIKAEYNQLYEAVGQEQKRREQADKS